MCHQLPQGALRSQRHQVRRQTQITCLSSDEGKEGQDSCADDDGCMLFDAAQNTQPNPLPWVQLSVFMVITSAVAEHLNSQN